MSTEYILQSATNFPIAMWIDAPAFAYQGCTTGTFKLYLYKADNNLHTVNLYAQGSNSMPWQEPQNKWSHLNPQWRFLDLSGNVINNLTLTDITTTTFGGTTGYLASSEFYYIDDMPTQSCGTLLLWAVADFSQYPVYVDIKSNSQNVPSYVNSKVIAVVPYLINQLTPSHFSVTRDGVNPMFDFYWTNTNISHIASVIGTTKTGTCSAVMKNIPDTNILGLSGGLIRRLITEIPNNSLTWFPNSANAYLSAYDYQNFNIGGYLKGKVVSDITATNIAISANGNVFYQNLIKHYPFLWISNPENNTLNRILAPCIDEDWLIAEDSFLFKYRQKIYDSTYLQVTAPTTNMSLTGFHGVYGIAIGGEFKDVWCTDVESDKVYKFDSEGILLSTFNFGENNSYTFGVTGGCTPAGIAIDGVSGVWVTFYDSTSVLCLDEYTGAIKDIIDFHGLEVNYSDPRFKPVLAEPDKNNNVWITYNNSVCSILVKYDTSTKISLTSITLPTCSNPMDIHVTSSNDIWVSLTNHAGSPYGTVSRINKYSGSSPYTLLSCVSTNVLNPAYLAMDSTESLWFTQSGNVLTRITSAGIVSSWFVGAFVNSALASPPNDIFLENALEGLCCDYFNKVYIINSIDNHLYTIKNEQVLDVMEILPDQNLAWYNDLGYIYTQTDESNKSAQAFGDWSGNRWVRKYGNLNTLYLSGALSGSSNLFNILDFNGYNIRRFNESWISNDQIKTFARSPHIADNPIFWDKYMNAVWGDASTEQGKAFGRQAYERIANFVANHADVNTCNIDQLYNLAQYTDVPIDDYNIEFPPDLRRIMDIASINQQLLWGSRCRCNKNITNEYKTYLSGQQTLISEYECEFCGHEHAGNRGDLFDATNYIVSAYVPFIIYDRANKSNAYQLITPPISCNLLSLIDINSDICEVSATSSICITSYPLSSYYNVLLPAVYDFENTPTWNDFQQAITYFCFYHYVPNSCDKQIAGVINWDDGYTTLQESASSLSTWYGNGQTLEKIINYILHKGLGLIEE